MTWIELVRWAHLVSGLGWFGAVLVVAFVLSPALAALDQQERLALLRHVFPRVFRLATVLVLLTAASGITLFFSHYGVQPAVLTTGRVVTLLVGATLGGALGGFHFFMEPRLERRIAAIGAGSAGSAEVLIKRLKVIPRVGLVILVSVTLLMVAAARGW